MRERCFVEIGSIEETEVEPLDEADGDVEIERPHPPIWHRRCSRCKTVYNVLKVKCPNCGRR
jgi:rRNA maturation endonuclease Nob1